MNFLKFFFCTFKSFYKFNHIKSLTEKKSPSNNLIKESHKLCTLNFVTNRT